MGFSLQEIMEKTATQRKEIEANMDQTHGGFHPREASIYAGLGDDDKRQIYETMQKISLPNMLAIAAQERGYLKYDLKEIVSHSGALTTGFTGSAGAGFSYLLPDKVYTALFENASMTDITPQISNVVDTPGSYLKIDCEVDGAFKPKFVASGGEIPDETIQTTQGTITPRMFALNIAVTNEMIEDNAFDTMATHISIAGKRMGEFSSQMCLFPVMDDHRGTATAYRIEGAYNVFNTGGATTFDWSDLIYAEGENAMDGFTTDVCVIPPHGPGTLLIGAAGYTLPLNEGTKINLKGNPITNWNGIDIVRCTHMTTSDTPAALQYYSGLYSTHWHALALNKTYGIQTVRKRWLKIENYADPIKDLIGAAVSSRQGHLVAYADACTIASYA